jgi:DNA-3-methyladenine glycosylase I
MIEPRQRCCWAQRDLLLREYHNAEWGVPIQDSRALWEKLMLDGIQAGLSWRTILGKRPAFRSAFKDFDPAIVARFSEDNIRLLLADSGIVRSRMKIAAAISNAKAYMAIHDAGASFAYIA